MAANRKTVERRVRENDDLIRMTSALDGAMTAIMMINIGNI